MQSTTCHQRLCSGVQQLTMRLHQPKRHLAAPYLWQWRVDWQPKPPLLEAEIPREQRKLPVRLKVPIPGISGSGAKWHYTKSVALYRGPELVHNKLIHRQFGIQALEAGAMLHAHFETIRSMLGKKMDVNRMFAVWRVDAPWKACYQRPPGLTLGGGKRDPKYYKSPVKDERIIMELGGNLEWQEAFRLLKQMAGYLPFNSRFVSQEMLDFESRLAQYTNERNINPLTFDYIREHNLCNVQRHLSPYAIKYGRRWW